MGDKIFKVLGLVCDCPVLVFDPISICAANPNGDYYAGAHGIDRTIFNMLGLSAPQESSIFTSPHPEHTLIAFSDSWGYHDLRTNFKDCMLGP